MSFRCPACKAPRLKIEISLELPPDGSNDEISLQAIRCAGCSFEGMAIYEESRRGSSDSWHHAGYPLPEGAYDGFVADLRRCPTPREARCGCETHAKYNVRKGYRWCGYEQLDPRYDGRFNLERT